MILKYHNDHLGTPQIITDQSQQVVWKASYNPFGEATMTTAAIENNLRFTGQYFDQETNLHYNYFRYYDPSIGRYITSDSIGVAGGLSTYGYAYQNPVKYTDPTGLFSPDFQANWLNRPPNPSQFNPYQPIPEGSSCETRCAKRFIRATYSSAVTFAGAGTGIGAFAGGSLIARTSFHAAMESNPQNLPQRIGPGEKLSETVRGHEKLLNRRLRELRNLEDEYSKNCVPMACL